MSGTQCDIFHNDFLTICTVTYNVLKFKKVMLEYIYVALTYKLSTMVTLLETTVFIYNKGYL